MAINPQYKVNKMAKDLGLKSKDLSDILASNGKEVKTQRTLEPVEFDILFETLTRDHQISNIEDYLDGVTKIPSAAPKAEPAKEDAAPAPEAPATPAPEPKQEPRAEIRAEEKPQEKAETKPAPELKPAPKAEAKPAPKAEPKPAPRAEAKPEVKPAPKAEPKPEVKQESKPAAKPAAPSTKPGAPRPAAPTQGNNQQNRGGQTAPAQRGDRPQQPYNAPRAPQQGTASGQGGYGQSRPAQGGMNSGRPAQGGFGQNRPAQGGFGGDRQGNRPAQGGFGGDRQGNRPAQNRPQQGGKGGSFGGGFDKDREYNQVGGLKETFRPQATIRVTNTNTSSAQRGATRVVDTRGSAAYDPSKYDEKLETFVSERDEALRGGGGGKMKRQQPGAARGTSNKNNFKGGKNKKTNEPAHILPTSVTLPEEIIVSDLASALKVKTGEVVKALMMMGIMATVNQVVDFDTAALVADSLGIEATKQVVVSIEEKLFDEAEDTEDMLQTRAPVVCVMGHVDHGKTSLLDAIRHTHVTAGEAGGITQHIGAYRVKVKGQDITFLDTPGHEAFTAMRARGAQSTDIAILVVAADDGIMPQTIEAINHAKAAGIDIIVAINKMDKPTANPDQVKQELTQYELVPEEWGGDVICVPVSALTGMGIDDLLENVLLVAEVKELKANPNRRAKGLVIEAKLDKGRGPVATVLVQNGTLHDGDIVIAGTAVGRVRAMTDHRGKAVKAAGPSVPVEIIGLAEVPTAGDEFQAVEDERMARTLADDRKNQAKEEGFRANARANLNDLFAQISDGVKTLNVIVKADVVGSAEAVKASLLKISNEEVKVSVIHAAAGGINEGDVMLAAASNAIVVGFNVRPDKTALDSAERQGVDIRTYRVIYDCIEEITAAMKGMLAPKYVEVLMGHAEVRQTIHVPGVGTIAGSYITDGKITRACKIRVLRDSVVIFEDEVASLKRFKDDAREVAQGYECGIGLEKFNDIKVGDVLEAYIMEEVKA
ncbi:MAG: translation initiation factor IF-2 [Ruminococcaceae bacterium]|nr:translation initiation factor IF-2 [Oscillospiraceae bacterium]